MKDARPCDMIHMKDVCKCGCLSNLNGLTTEFDQRVNNSGHIFCHKNTLDLLSSKKKQPGIKVLNC
jgi:hypothetical protein